MEANNKIIDRINIQTINTDKNSVRAYSPSKDLSLMRMSNETFVQPNTMVGSMINIDMQNDYFSSSQMDPPVIHNTFVKPPATAGTFVKDVRDSHDKSMQIDFPAASSEEAH